MNNNLTRRAHSSPPAPLPKTGYVTIAGKRHLVRIEPYQQPVIQQQPDPKSIKRQPTYYEVPQRHPQQTAPRLHFPNPLHLTLSLIIATLFLVGASMFSISLTAYSNSVERTDRIRSLIHVE